MSHTVSIVTYDRPKESVAEVIDLCDAFDKLKKGDKVFIKPNIVLWYTHAQIPPWGVITTSRVIEDVVRELKNCGAGQITIGEGIIPLDQSDKNVSAHAFEALGYHELSKRYGVKLLNTLDNKFRKKSLGDKVSLNFSADLLDADFVVNLPVLKTHAQTVVSLGQKNLKGCLDLNSRKRCHSMDKDRDLDFHVSKLADILPKSCTIIDGIYSLERGPTYTGTARRSNILIASQDMLSADIVGSVLLGIDPANVPHLEKACERRGISPSVDSVEIVGEPVEMWATRHEWDFPYNKDGTLPINLEFMGIKGLSFPKYDHSLCTYCSGVTGLVQVAIGKAWKGAPFDKVEILTGKMAHPTPGMNHTILLGKCQVKLNKENKKIRHPILVPGCPPKMDKLAAALKNVGIEVDDNDFNNPALGVDLFMGKYEKRPEFSMDFYKISG